MSEDAFDRLIHHPIRRRLIEALWYSDAPISVRRFHADYALFGFGDGPESVSSVLHHLGQLEAGGVVELTTSNALGDLERFSTLSGPNSAEAVKRLGLSEGQAA